MNKSKIWRAIVLLGVLGIGLMLTKPHSSQTNSPSMLLAGDDTKKAGGG